MAVTISDGSEEGTPAGLASAPRHFPHVRSKRKAVASRGKRVGFAISHVSGQLLQLSASFSAMQSRLWRERKAGEPPTASS